MRLYPAHLLPDVLLQIVKGMEMHGRTGGRPHLLRQLLLEFVFPHSQQTAVGVVDDDELLRVEQVERNNQRADRVVSRNSAGVTNHVRVSGMQPGAAFKPDSGFDAGQDGEPAAWLDSQVSQVEVLHKLLVSLQQFVGD
jgi:hypothetical protein